MNSYFCKHSSWHTMVCFRHDSGGKGGTASSEGDCRAAEDNTTATLI